MASWFEMFGAEKYFVEVDGSKVTIGYEGKVIGDGEWVGGRLRIRFLEDHFYGLANKDAKPDFMIELEKRISTRLGA